MSMAIDSLNPYRYIAHCSITAKKQKRRAQLNSAYEALFNYSLSEETNNIITSILPRPSKNMTEPSTHSPRASNLDGVVAVGRCSLCKHMREARHFLPPMRTEGRSSAGRQAV